MIAMNRQPDYTNCFFPPALAPTEIPAGLVTVGDEVAFFYGAETVTAVETDGDWVTVRFADVEPALYLACDPVAVLRETVR